MNTKVILAQHCFVPHSFRVWEKDNVNDFFFIWNYTCSKALLFLRKPSWNFISFPRKTWNLWIFSVSVQFILAGNEILCLPVCVNGISHFWHSIQQQLCSVYKQIVCFFERLFKKGLLSSFSLEWSVWEEHHMAESIFIFRCSYLFSGPLSNFFKQVFFN